MKVGLDQYGIRKFAEAFEVVPRTLVENSGCDPTSTMFALHNAHIKGLGSSGCLPANIVSLKEKYKISI